jgi:hypothetical protein
LTGVIACLGQGTGGYFLAENDPKSAYRAAYDDWQRQIQMLHRVFLDGETLASADRMKGLLNREVRAFEKYQEARLRLLGIPSDQDSADGDLPF